MAFNSFVLLAVFVHLVLAHGGDNHESVASKCEEKEEGEEGYYNGPLTKCCETAATSYVSEEQAIDKIVKCLSATPGLVTEDGSIDADEISRTLDSIRYRSSQVEEDLKAAALQCSSDKSKDTTSKFKCLIAAYEQECEGEEA